LAATRSASATAHIDAWTTRSQRIVIQNVRPAVDAGRYPIKREVGDALEATAEIFKEGHGKLRAVLKLRRVGVGTWDESPMELVNPGLDLWRGAIPLPEVGRYEYTIEAWTDEFETWRDEFERKQAAGHDVRLELTEGRSIVAAARGRAVDDDARVIARALAEFDARGADVSTRAAALLSVDLRTSLARCPDRTESTVHEPALGIVVDRIQARFAAWYEMFPRSQGREPGRSGTFQDCVRRFADVRAMGFDVVYFVPIHPIGRVNRKGRNNTLEPGPGDPGSPYAIGAGKGGHCAVNPELGTLEDFRALVRAAHEHWMEVALDFAIQCAPDHPWVKEHPEWFVFRPDGSIKCAENPPKRYQDIVNLNFYGPHKEVLWDALRDVTLFWIEQGVRIFRVDNPHTKPVPFWEWLINDVKSRHPDVIFLSEAFTRPPMLKMLAKVGFSQSYTYFTWRNFKHELRNL
jgi:starch synthase (maltosyl-transferring)